MNIACKHVPDLAQYWPDGTWSLPGPMLIYHLWTVLKEIVKVSHMLDMTEFENYQSKVTATSPGPMS